MIALLGLIHTHTHRIFNPGENYFYYDIFGADLVTINFCRVILYLGQVVSKGQSTALCLIAILMLFEK